MAHCAAPQRRRFAAPRGKLRSSVERTDEPCEPVAVMRVVLGVVLASACTPPRAPVMSAHACGAGLIAARRATPRGIESWCADAAGVRQGPFERRLPHGVVAERGSYGAGHLDGEYAAFYADGVPHVRGQYVRGRRQGAWRAWHENGTRWLEVAYVDGAPTGAWREYGANGALVFEGTYQGGALDGAWRAFLADGNEGAVGRSRAGRLEGSILETLRDGSKAETPFRDNRIHGTRVFYDKDGKVTARLEYVDGVPRDPDAD